MLSSLIYITALNSQPNLGEISNLYFSLNLRITPSQVSELSQKQCGNKKQNIIGRITDKAEKVVSNSISC